MNMQPCRIGLIVTGKGEECFLHDLLNREMTGDAYCLFSVIRFFPQLSPITSPRRQLKIVGTHRSVNTRDEELGLCALNFIRQHDNSYVIVVDDLEADRQQNVSLVFQRYRNALNGVLGTLNLHHRAAVHFLANMLESYYFAHSQAVNEVAGSTILDADHPSNVEMIRNPKSLLRQKWPIFHEIDHGVEITRLLDLHHILSRPTECCWLRALVAWCVDKLHHEDAFYDILPARKYCLDNGCKHSSTYPQ